MVCSRFRQFTIYYKFNYMKRPIFSNTYLIYCLVFLCSNTQYILKVFFFTITFQFKLCMSNDREIFFFLGKSDQGFCLCLCLHLTRQGLIAIHRMTLHFYVSWLEIFHKSTSYVSALWRVIKKRIPLKEINAVEWY